MQKIIDKKNDLADMIDLARDAITVEEMAELIRLQNEIAEFETQKGKAFEQRRKAKGSTAEFREVEENAKKEIEKRQQQKI